MKSKNERFLKKERSETKKRRDIFLHKTKEKEKWA
jgi:hypothetical protein